jgi:hypothetical protein
VRFVPFGCYDPTCRRVPGRLWKAARTPEGPVTLQLARQEGRVAARAWGPGADWALAAVPGCGPWTVEISMGFVLGDPDAVPTGDLHLPHEVGRALAGEEHADDARMLDLLEPFRGQRFRLLRLLIAAGRVRLGRSVR